MSMQQKTIYRQIFIDKSGMILTAGSVETKIHDRIWHF